MHCSWGWAGAVILGGAFLLAPARADEARLANGRSVPGTLTLTRSGRLLFTPTDRRVRVAPADLTQVRFTAAPPAFRAGAGHRLRLRAGGHLTGLFLGLDRDALTLRTAWANKQAVPRASTAALEHLPGWRTLFADDFTPDLKPWSARGEPAVKAGVVKLSATGQTLRYTPPAGLSAGRVGINFEERDTPAGARWELALRFAGKGGPRSLRITVAGAGEHSAVEGDFKGTARRVARSPGWHRLVVRFSATSLSVLCDDSVLWFNLEQGPGGPLNEVRLACLTPGKAARTRGAVAWTAFTLERAVAERPHPPGDEEQDELWLAGGDQLFGRVLRADRRGVTLEARFGTRTFAWADLTGWYPRHVAGKSRPLAGPRVRVWLHSGLTAEPDVLDGVVAALDARHLTLRHADLGELRLDRRWLARLRPLTPKPARSPR
jgi:hypothetical protein